MRTLLIYSPALVLAIWSLVWQFGSTGIIVTVIGLLILLGALVAHSVQEYGGHHGR